MQLTNQQLVRYVAMTLDDLRMDLIRVRNLQTRGGKYYKLANDLLHQQATIETITQTQKLAKEIL